MAIEILEGKHGKAALYCGSSGWAFGPIMDSADIAEAFLQWCRPADPRTIEDADLEKKYLDFLRDMVCECGEVRVTTCDYCADEVPVSADHRHLWDDGGEQFNEECQKDVAPAAGDKFRCNSCRETDARKRAAKFIRDLEKRSMSTWTDAELAEYNRLTLKPSTPKEGTK